MGERKHSSKNMSFANLVGDQRCLISLKPQSHKELRSLLNSMKNRLPAPKPKQPMVHIVTSAAVSEKAHLTNPNSKQALDLSSCSILNSSSQQIDLPSKPPVGHFLHRQLRPPSNTSIRSHSKYTHSRVSWAHCIFHSLLTNTLFIPRIPCPVGKISNSRNRDHRAPNELQGGM